MQVNKKGEIINAPQFLINGDARRKLKKEVWKLKQLIHYFWFYNDINEVYGVHEDKEQLKQRFSSLQQELSGIEKKLAVPFIKN